MRIQILRLGASLPNGFKLPQPACRGHRLSIGTEDLNPALLRRRVDEIGHRDRAVLCVGLNGRAIHNQFQIVRTVRNNRRLRSYREFRRDFQAGLRAIDIKLSLLPVKSYLRPVLLIGINPDAEGFRGRSVKLKIEFIRCFFNEIFLSTPDPGARETGLLSPRSAAITGSCFRASPALSCSRESRRGRLIWPRQGEVGSLAAYCQLLIQPSRTGLSVFGRPL